MMSFPQEVRSPLLCPATANGQATVTEAGVVSLVGMPRANRLVRLQRWTEAPGGVQWTRVWLLPQQPLLSRVSLPAWVMRGDGRWRVVGGVTTSGAAAAD